MSGTYIKVNGEWRLLPLTSTDKYQ